MENESCEVVLIAGFLGAGKTTLMRNILAWPGDLSKTAVLVNEFGQMGIDGELLQGFQTPVYELTNGCICCTLQGEFHSIVVEILDGFHPKRILMEATGVADPYDILGFLKASRIENRISAPKVVTVLAGDMWEGREYFGPLFYNQIRAAELLLFNKVDLLSEEEVPRSLQEIREINPTCSVVPTHHCHVDPEALWKPGVGGEHQTEFHLPHAHTEHGSAQEMGYVSFAFEDRSPFKRDCFHLFIDSLPIEMYRVKGFALLEDKRFFLNHVGGRTEWVELDEAGPTKLAFVGWHVNEEETLKALKVCLNP